MNPSIGLLCALALPLLLQPAAASPRIPASGAQVLERLPARSDPAQRELLRLRAALSTDPTDVELATSLARRYIEQARREGDPRYLGYAQAALAPWWVQAAPPPPVLVLRATLRQSTHQFGSALLDLDQLVGRDPDNAQAWLTRATVQQVTGAHAAAKASCMRLHARAPEVVVQTCLSSAGSVSGRARASYDELRQTLARRPETPAPIRVWVETLLGEMAARLGERAAAERHFQSALLLDRDDSYLLGAYADFLLDTGRASDAARLLRDKTRADALLLRYAIALKTMADGEAARHGAMLAARFEAAARRGDTVHQREQARFELAVRGDAAAAVRLAKLNWSVQKEPADLRILADAARVSGDGEARRLVRDWLDSTGLEDHALGPAWTRREPRT